MLTPSPLQIPYSYIYRINSHDRFLRVRLMTRRQWSCAGGAHAVELLAREGLHFACRRYKYLSHKVGMAVPSTPLKNPPNP
jgi:hypothetical protein